MFKHKRSYMLPFSGFILTLFMCLGSADAYAGISYAYHTSSNLDKGDIVSLIAKNSNYVEPTNTSNSSNLLGIVTSSNDSLLEVDPSSSTVQVTTSGSVPVLVSTINGSIAVGDQISVSPLSGIGMKAESGLPLVGLAENSFSMSSPNTTFKKVVDNSGKTQTVGVGYVLVTTKIGAVSNSAPQLNGLQQFVKNLTGHTVSTIRIVISLVISILAIIVLGALIYSSVFGSIISIGRNPLAKASIKRTLIGVLAMAIVLALVTVIVVDLLLS